MLPSRHYASIPFWGEVADFEKRQFFGSQSLVSLGETSSSPEMPNLFQSFDLPMHGYLSKPLNAGIPRRGTII